MDGIYPERTLVTWEITCLFDTLPTGGANSNGDDVAQVLAFYISSQSASEPLGFTVSWKQLKHPEIIRLSPTTVNLAVVKAHPEEWRTKTQDLAPLNAPPELVDVENELPSFTRHGQKTLQAGLQAIGHFVTEKVKAIKTCLMKAVESCRKKIEEHCYGKAADHDKSNKLLSGDDVMQMDMAPVKSDHLLEAPYQNETRSITTLEPAETLDALPFLSPSPSSCPTPTP